MYSGRKTWELRKLYKEYKAKYGHSPEGSLDVEYDANDYDAYVGELRYCLAHDDTELGDLFRYYDDEDIWL